MKNNYSIILVEDDPGDHIFFRKALKKININCNLTALHDGAELIEFLSGKEKKSNAAIDYPDVIVLDLNMPVMNGFETLQKLNSNLKSIPVYILSKSSSSEDINRALELGVKRFYTKPEDGNLRQIIAEILIDL